MLDKASRDSHSRRRATGGSRDVVLNTMTAAMAFIMGTWLLAGTLFVCFGALAYRRLGMAIQEAKDLFACFWIGWACTIAFLQLWHLWCPSTCAPG